MLLQPGHLDLPLTCQRVLHCMSNKQPATVSSIELAAGSLAK